MPSLAWPAIFCPSFPAFLYKCSDSARTSWNPEHFDKPEAGVTSVLVMGDWPNVVEAYEAAGIDVSVREAKRVPMVGATNQAELEKIVAALRAEHGSIEILIGGLEAGEMHRPESGELALRLFDLLGTIHISVGTPTTERDGLLLTVDALRGEVEALKKAAPRRRLMRLVKSRR